MRRYVLIAICLHAFFASVGQVVNPSVLSIEQLGGNGDEFFYGARKVYDGGFILNISTNSGAGNINNSCSNNGRLVYRKYNPAGVLEWEKCRPGIFTISMSMPGEEICFFGVKWVSSLDTLIFQKEDANGNILITKKYDGGGNDYLKDVIQTDDGGFVILGDSYSSGGDVGSHYGSQFFKDIWVFKIDANGIIKWSKVIGGTNDDISYSIVHGPNNGFYIAGNTESNDIDCTGQHGHRDMYLARLDSLGNIIWHRCFGGSQDDGYYVSAVENNGGVIIATGSQSSDGDIHHALGNYDFWVLSVDSSGKIMWENSYGGDNQEVPKNICKGNDASIWIGGSSNRQTGEVDAYYGLGDAWIAHVDADGNFLSGKVLGGNKQDECTLLYPLTTNLIFVGGTYHKN